MYNSIFLSSILVMKVKKYLNRMWGHDRRSATLLGIFSSLNRYVSLREKGGGETLFDSTYILQIRLRKNDALSREEFIS